MTFVPVQVFVDPKMVQQAPDKRLASLEEQRDSARVSLTRRGCLLRMQLLFVDSILWVSVFMNDMLVDVQSLILPGKVAVIPFVHMGSAGHMFQSLPSLFTNLCCDHFKFQLPGKKERKSPQPISHMTWPGDSPPAVSSTNSIYSAYCNFRDFEAEVLPHPSNDLAVQRINLPLQDPRADNTRAVLEAVLEGVLQEKDGEDERDIRERTEKKSKLPGEVRFCEDLPLLCALCSSEQIWRFVARKRDKSELHKAVQALLQSSPLLGWAEQTRRRRMALEGLAILLQFPHTYEALFEMSFLQAMADEICMDLGSVRDDVSDASGLTVRLNTRALRGQSWKNRLRAAQNTYALLGTTAHLLSPVEAPAFISLFNKARSLVGTETQERAEVNFLLLECQDAISTDLSKFTAALKTYQAGGVGLTPGADHASVILNILNTLCHMLGRDEYPTRSAESEHQAHRLKMHASSNIYQFHVPDSSGNVITFDNLPIGNGAVEILEGGVRKGLWSRLADPHVKIHVQSDTFQWRFKYESEEVTAVQDTEDAADRENRGYRFVVRPVWDTDDKDTILVRRKMVLDEPGFMKLLTSLHSHSKGLGPSGAKVQADVDLKIVMLLSFLVQRGSEPPHPAIIEDALVEKIVFQIMFQLLEKRPSIEEQTGVGGKRRIPLDRSHIAVARFYHGVSSSEEGRQHFAYHQEAIMKIVDIANNNTQGATKPECQPPPHEALCYDGNYIIRRATLKIIAGQLCDLLYLLVP